MERLKEVPIYVVATLVVCTSAVWGQAPAAPLFQDGIEGTATTACTVMKYSRTGGTKQGYNLIGSVNNPCPKIASASAASDATIGPPVVNASGKGGKKDAAGQSSAYSMDTAFLTPPAGFTDESVHVVAETGYVFELSAQKPRTASWTILWQVNGHDLHEVIGTTNGNGNLSVNLPFDVSKTSSGFKLRYDVICAVNAALGASASCGTSGVILHLPQGWKYIWASNDAGYGRDSLQAGQ